MSTDAAPRRARTRRARSASPARDVTLARMAKALGHPARVAILRMLVASGECHCQVIVDQLPLAQATVSQHLKVLKQAGLVRGDIDPPRVCYCVNPEAVERLKSLIGEL